MICKANLLKRLHILQMMFSFSQITSSEFLKQSKIKYLTSDKAPLKTSMQFNRTLISDIRDFVNTVSSQDVNDSSSKQYCNAIIKIMSERQCHLQKGADEDAGVVMSHFLNKAVLAGVDVTSIVSSNRMLKLIGASKTRSDLFFRQGLHKCKLGSDFFKAIESLENPTFILGKMLEENIEKQRVMKVIINIFEQPRSTYSSLDIFYAKRILSNTPTDYDTDKLYIHLIKNLNTQKNEFEKDVWNILSQLPAVKNNKSPELIESIVDLAETYCTSRKSESILSKANKLIALVERTKIDRTLLIEGLQRLKKQNISIKDIDAIIERIKDIKSRKIISQRFEKIVAQNRQLISHLNRLSPLKMQKAIQYLESDEVKHIPNIQNINKLLRFPEFGTSSDALQIYNKLKQSKDSNELIIAKLIEHVYNLNLMSHTLFEKAIRGSSKLKCKGLMALLATIKAFKPQNRIMQSLLNMFEPTIKASLGNPQFINPQLAFYATMLKHIQNRNILSISAFDKKIIQTIIDNKVTPDESYIIYAKEIALHRKLEQSEIKILMLLVKSEGTSLTHVHVLFRLFDLIQLTKPQDILTKQTAIRSLLKTNLSKNDIVTIYANQVKKGEGCSFIKKQIKQKLLLEVENSNILTKDKGLFAVILKNLASDDPQTAKRIYMANKEAINKILSDSMKSRQMFDKILTNQFGQALHLMDLLTPELASKIQSFVNSIQQTPKNISYKQSQVTAYIKSKGDFDIKLHQEFYPFTYDIIVNDKIAIQCQGYQHNFNKQHDNKKKEFIEKLGFKLVNIFNQSQCEEKLGRLLEELRSAKQSKTQK